LLHPDEERELLKKSLLSKLFPVLLIAYLSMMIVSFNLAYHNIPGNSVFLVLLNFLGLFFFFIPLLGLYNKKGGLLSLTLFSGLDAWFRNNTLTFTLFLMVMFSPSCVYAFNIWLDSAEPKIYQCRAHHLNKAVNKGTTYHFYFRCPELQKHPLRLMITGKQDAAENFFRQAKKGDLVDVAIKPGALSIQHIDDYWPASSTVLESK